MRSARLVAVVSAVLLCATPWVARAQQADPYVSCVKCHALPSAQAQGQLAQHGIGFPPSPEMACQMCHGTWMHEQNPEMPAFPRYFLQPDPTHSGQNTYLTNHCTSCHPGLHGHAFDDQNNALLEKMPYGPASPLVAGAPTSVLPLFDPWGAPNQDRFIGGMVCSTCHDPHEPSYPYGSNSMPKFLRVGSPAAINQLCSACHDAPNPPGAAPDLVIPSRSNSVRFSSGPFGDQMIEVALKNRGNAFFTGGNAQVSWVNGFGYPMPIVSLWIPALPPDMETTTSFGWVPPPDWTAGEGFYVFSLPPSSLLPGTIKEFVRAMNVTPTPENLRVTLAGPTSIDLVWDPPLPGSGVVTFDVYRDGVKVNPWPVVVPSYTDSGLAPETPHLYSVKALNAEGEASEASSPVGGTTLASFVIRVPQELPTIQDAINAAAPGTSIHVAPGTYTEALSFAGKEGITVKGQDANGCVLDYGANPGATIDLGPAFSFQNGNTIAGFTIRDARILMYPGDVLFGCVVALDGTMPPMTYSAIVAMGGLATQCVFDGPFPAAEIPFGGFFAAVNSAFLYSMPLWHPGMEPASAALLVHNSFNGWPQYVEYQGSGNFTGFPAFEPPGPWPPPGTFFTTQASVTTDRGLPLGTPDTYNGAAPDVGVFEVGRPYTPRPPSSLAASFEPGPIGFPGAVRLDWLPSTDAPPRVQYYLVYRATEPFFPPGSEMAPHAVLPAWSVPMTYLDHDVAPGTVYYYQVRADAGPAAPPATGSLLSAPSNTASSGNSNQPPVAVPDVAETFYFQPLTIDVIANDFDPDGDQLRVESVTQPYGGTAVVETMENKVTYRPGSWFLGLDTFTYTVSDGRGRTATATVTVDVVPGMPGAAPDNYTATEDVPLTVPVPGVLANDISYRGVKEAILWATPAHGGLQLLASGEFTYVPGRDFAGTDSFIYRVWDGVAYSSLTTVTITVRQVNDAPAASAQFMTTGEDTAAAVTLAATDADGDALTFRVTAGPAHGTLSGDAPNLTYTPALDYYGQDTFSFVANDGAVDSPAAVVSVTVAPGPRSVVATTGTGGTITPAGNLNVSHGSVLSFTIAAGTGYHVVAVAGCGGTLDGTTYTTAPITADCSVTADFAVNRYTLAVAKAGTGSGTVTSTPSGIACGSVCSTDYSHGSSVTLTAAPSGNSFFAGWSGACSGMGACVVAMDAATSVTATFAPVLTVTAPNGGENWRRSTTYTVRWTYAGNPGPYVKIELLKGGTVNRTIVSSRSVGSNGAGSYSWKVPSNQTLGPDHRVRVTSTGNGSYTDTSDGNFTIVKQ